MKQLSTRLAEHQAAIRRRDLHSQIWLYIDETGHSFNFDDTKAIAAANRQALEFIEACHSTSQSINRRIALYAAYLPTRARSLTEQLNTRISRPPDHAT